MIRFGLFMLGAVFLVGSTSVQAQTDGDVAGDPGPSTANWLFASTFDCFQDGCQYENAVLRYEATTGAFLGVHIANIEGPTGIAVHPSRGTLLVASRSTNTVKEFNIRTGVQIRNFVTPNLGGLNLPQAILFRPNGNLLVTSSQSANNLSAVNGIIEYDGDDGSLVSVFIDGGFYGQNCGDEVCLFGPSAMVYGPNGNLYVASTSNDLVIEYNGSTGAYVGSFDSTKLKYPTSIAIRPTGTTRAGNLLVTSRYRDPAIANDKDKILEFDKTTRNLITTGSTFVTNLNKPGPMMWHSTGYLIVDDRSLTELAPTFADRLAKYNRDTGAFLGNYTAANDARLHQVTGLLAATVTLGSADDDYDNDDDVDLRDFAHFQHCYQLNGVGSCNTPFDDDLNGTINLADASTFTLQMSGPLP